MIPFLKAGAHAQPERLLPFSIHTAVGRDLDALAALLGWPERQPGEDDATIRGRICGDVAPRPEWRRHYYTPSDDYRQALREMAENWGVFS